VRLSSPAALAGAVLAAASAGCVGYRPAPLDIERPIRAPAGVPSPISFDEALKIAVDRNPDLVALRARASAVNLKPAREPIEVSGGVDADQRKEATVAIDALSLLGLGLHRTERVLAVARRDEALMAHHVRAREIAGEIAEVFALERALSTLPQPDVSVDASMYVRAGFESASAESAAAATREDWRAEAAVRAAAQESNRLALARLLGVPPTDVRPAAVDEAWPPVRAADPRSLLCARAELQRRMAAFEVADAELRRAVAAQYPSVVLEPGIAADPTALFGAVRLRIPVGAGADVRAAECAREAARAEVESAVLDALRDASLSRQALTAAGAIRTAADRRLAASAELFRVGRTRLEVAEGSVIEVVLAGDAVVDAARSLREARMEEARARVKAALDSGWPCP
jgi:hypothetical protein